MKCPHCAVPIDPFAGDTEYLNAWVRETVDAIWSQLDDNPAVSSALSQAAERLHAAAVAFTNALYAEEAA